MKTDQTNMNYDYGIPGTLLRFLGACVFGDAAAFYAGLNESGRDELEAQGRNSGMTAWFYRYLYDVLPNGKRAEYRMVYQARQVKNLMGEPELKRFYGMLAAHGLRFVPIKGADLAYRLYPDAALRPFCDWDIWFHPDDCERALEVLREDGWKIPGRYSDSHNDAIKTTIHHFSPHVKNHITVEPHCSLSNFKDVDPVEIWEYTAEYPDGDGQRVLTPEMNLLMLTRHASSQSYYHARIPKLLTDAAMVIREENVDFAKLRELAGRWRLPNPGDLLAAFPEFFPEDVLAEFHADPRKKADFRRMFELRGKLGGPNVAALLLGRSRARGQAVGSLLKYFPFSPVKIRRIHHLPKRGAWGRVAWAYLSYFGTRTVRVVKALFHRNPVLQEYARLIEKSESVQKP